MIDIILLGGLVLALVEVVKIALGGRYSRFYPLISIAIGLSLSAILNYQYGTIQEIITSGIIVGASAVGLWELSRHSILGK
ncbi:MAG: hypothetical protein PHU82_02765 [Candidatus Pacebacteria bacterium]|nr:hypothetical protein [Candidatus Paceibacterota bacterium]